MDFSDLLYHHALAMESAAVYYYDTAALSSLRESIAGMMRCLEDGGKLIFVGCGKSFKIICKTVAMLTSIGIPARELHPIEAMHGDLGYCNPKDALVFCSTSGETDEVMNLLRYMRAEGSLWVDCVRIAVTGNEQSTLATHCHHTIVIPQNEKFKETALQGGLRAPTVSTSLMIAILDCICIELSNEWFDRDPVKREMFFNKRHPGGGIGKITSKTNLKQLMDLSTDYQLPKYHTYCVQENETITETQLLSILISYDYIQFSAQASRVPTALLREEHKRAFQSGHLPAWFSRYL